MNSRKGRDSTFGIILFIANIYLIAFALDGGLSLLDETLQRTASIRALGSLRGALAGLVTVASFLVLVLVVFVPRLPKLVLVPLAVFAVWCVFGAPPFIWAEDGFQGSLFILALAQLALAGVVFGAIKARTGTCLLNAQAFLPKNRLWCRIVVAGVSLVLVLPAFLAAQLALNLATMIQKETDGYVRFTGAGIELQETVMTRGDKTVHLVGMLHIGEPRFYSALYAGFPTDALIIEEGATDREGRLSGHFSYRRFAEVIGLAHQPRPGNSPPALGESPHTPGSAKKSAPAGRLINPDIDVSEFSESTIRFLTQMGAIYQSGDLLEAFARIMEMADEFTPEEVENFYEDVVYRRNRRVLEAIDDYGPAYDDVVIPWGALHMPGLEAGLRDRGYDVASRHRKPLIEYATIFSRILAVRS